jgi:hypothetical protein
MKRVEKKLSLGKRKNPLPRRGRSGRARLERRQEAQGIARTTTPRCVWCAAGELCTGFYGLRSSGFSRVSRAVLRLFVISLDPFFRKLFLRLAGLRPREYQQRFTRKTES